MAPYNGTPRYFEDFKVETWLAYGLDGVEPPDSPNRIESDDGDEALTTNSILPPTFRQPSSPKRKRLSAVEAFPRLKRRLPPKYPLRETTMNPKFPPNISHDDMDPGGKGAKPRARRSPRKAVAPPLTAIEETTMMSGQQSASDKTESVVRSDTDVQSSSFSGGLQLTNELILRPGLRNTNSSTRSRSSSPVKTMHDLEMAEPAIKFMEANLKKLRPPQEVSALYTKLLDIQEGFQLLPASLRV